MLQSLPVDGQYSFNFDPDCTYWLTLHRLNAWQRDCVPDYIYVKRDIAMTPYLTVEFKKPNQTSREAQDRIACAPL